MGYLELPKIDGEFNRAELPKGYFLGIIGMLFGLVAPQVARLAGKLGFEASAGLVFWGTIGLGIACVGGAIISCLLTRRQVAEDLADLRPDLRRERH